jgi:transglutaminase-like putative cysteine protease
VDDFRFSWTVGRIPTAGATRTTLAIIKQLALRDSRSPEIRLLAQELTHDFPSYDSRSEVEALHRFVRDSIRYTRDVLGAETVQSPRLTLRVGSGDCDDKAGLLGSLLLAVGHRVRYVLARTDPMHADKFTHIYVETPVGSSWMALETIVPGMPAGKAPRQFGAPYREE